MRTAALVTCLVLAAAAASAQVRLTTLPDGTRLMSNQGSWRPPLLSTAVARPEIDRLIDLHARRQRLDPALVRAVVRVESAFNPRALSRKGAMGLMQLMPATARSLAVSDPYDPAQNLRGGTTYLRRLIDEFGGDLTLALAGYNAGPEAVRRYVGIPPYRETRQYVTTVMQEFRGVTPDLSARPAGPGRKTYLRRDTSGRLVLTTEPAVAR